MLRLAVGRGRSPHGARAPVPASSTLGRMTMFENVLVGVDGSANGRDAIALAAKLIEPGGKLTLAHVIGGELNPVHAIVPGMVGEEHEASQALLESERAAADIAAELVSVVAARP